MDLKTFEEPPTERNIRKGHDEAMCNVLRKSPAGSEQNLGNWIGESGIQQVRDGMGTGMGSRQIQLQSHGGCAAVRKCRSPVLLGVKGMYVGLVTSQSEAVCLSRGPREHEKTGYVKDTEGTFDQTLIG